jgi:predicted transcriptional regulator
MAKTNAIGVRLSPEEREALDKAARSDDRSISALARKIISDWLREKGHLK